MRRLMLLAAFALVATLVLAATLRGGRLTTAEEPVVDGVERADCPVGGTHARREAA